MRGGLNRLTDKSVKALERDGVYSDGGGLYIRRRGASKSWLYKWTTVSGKRKEISLGRYPALSLKDARIAAQDYRNASEKGLDPRSFKDMQKAEPIMWDVIQAFLKVNEPNWKSDKHRKQWRYSLETLAKPLHDLKPSQVTVSAVEDVLKPIWHETPETAERTRARIERVMNFALAKRYYEGINPAIKDIIHVILPPVKRRVKHHAAIDYRDMPGFMARLQARESFAARLVEFTILSCVRSAESRFSVQDEFHFNTEDGPLWIIPAERRKGRIGKVKAHTVPLTPRMMALVEEGLSHREKYVFTNPAKRAAFSTNAAGALLKRMGHSETLHGFRSSFKDWAMNETDAEWWVTEECLSHQVGNKSSRAYRRSEALAKRRELLEKWEAYLYGASENISSFPTPKKRRIKKNLIAERVAT